MAWVEYIRRNRRETKFQLKAFGMVIDWTVFIYILVPAMIALGVIDYQLWQATPVWTSFVPVSLLGLGLFFASQLSSVRTYIEPADELFVIQNLRYYKTLIQAGKWFIILKTSLETAILILYILPILKLGYHLSTNFIIIIYFYVFIWSLFVKLASRWFALRGLRWRYRAFTIMAVVVYSTGFSSFFGQYMIVITITVFILVMVFAGFKLQEGIWKSFITHPFTRNLGALTVNESIIAKAKKRSLTVTWLIPLAILER